MIFCSSSENTKKPMQSATGMMTRHRVFRLAQQRHDARHDRHGGDAAGDDAEQLDVGQQVRQEDDDDGAEDRPEPRFAPAHGHGQQEQDR